MLSRLSSRLTILGLLLSAIALGQAVSEFPLPTGLVIPTEIVAGQDGNLYFAAYSGIGRVTIAGDVTQVSIGSVARVFDLVFDEEGNLWFTQETAPGIRATKIARLARNGLLSEFPLPAGRREAFSIAYGADGNIWFTEPADSRIGRITPSGAIAEFDVPVNPFAITSGPDGSLWFTAAGNRVGRISLSGAVSVFELGGDNPHAVAGAITAGPDGAMWFTDYRGRIGRITIEGIISQFAIPQFEGQGLPGIAVGPDGNLWFTVASAPVGPPPPDVPPSKIGRITPSGAISQLPLPNPWAYPHGITAGPDGNLWVTEFYVNKIARIPPSVLPPAGPAADVPTLSAPALAVFSLLLVAAAVLALHRFH